MSAQWPGTGGGGLVGPGSSTANAVAVYTDGTGASLSDGTVTTQMLVPSGDGIDSTGNPGQLQGNLSLAFSGLVGGLALNAINKTGFKMVKVGVIDYLELYVQSGLLLTLSGNRASGPANVITISGSGTLRPDTSALVDLGTTSSGFVQVYADLYCASVRTGNTARAVYFTTLFGGAPTVATAPWGIGLNSIDGSEFYLALYPGGAKYVQAFNVTCTAQSMVTVSAPANPGGNYPNSSVNAVTLLYKGANSLGTGNAGNLLLGTSTSVSGTEGNPCMANTSGAPAAPTVVTGFSPFRFDPATSKLYIHNGTAWKSVTLV